MLGELRRPIETALQSACDFGQGCPDHLAAAMRYALLAPGKRLRPILVLMSAEACSLHSTGESIADNTRLLNQVMPGAVAVEMIHAYSLIHDDLPAMDDDDLRRGRPTVHIEFDEATAILAGDALQAEAFQHLCCHVSDPVKLAAAVSILSSAASASHLVGGQADDLKAENDHHPESVRSVDWLESIHRRKTGALFSASLDLGAVLSDATGEQRSALAGYASHLGLAFQVVDDYLDFTADAAVLGKRAGKDAERGKLTYPGLLGAQQAKEKAVSLIGSAKQEALFFGPAAKRLLWLADYVLERTH
ncbi:Farnesyl diphosphate synthase [Rubripirellula obstinata]|uniref:Farnesyl diphosphate synthase n=2 Tax=Rubripirellula obstinata TaxID=406547 RepID=A0A5B1CH59_9BACT|nr:Farnesyl diphosphate synthase [Rubripirellula obstinata]